MSIDVLEEIEKLKLKVFCLDNKVLKLEEDVRVLRQEKQEKDEKEVNLRHETKDTRASMSSSIEFIEKRNKYLPVNLKTNNIPYNKIGYITICSSVATTGKKPVELSNDGSQTKAALAGAAEDVEKILKFFNEIGPNYIRQGKYEFSNQSVNSLSKDDFLRSIKMFFDSPVTDASIFYYSGHGFPNSNLLFETCSGNYYISYDELISLWRERKNKKRNKQLLVILDCCYSGSWVDQLLKNGDYLDVAVQSSSTIEQKSLDLGADRGSLFTQMFIDANTSTINELKLKSIEQYLMRQTPTSLVYEDVYLKGYGLKHLNFNDWGELLKHYEEYSINENEFMLTSRLILDTTSIRQPQLDQNRKRM